MVSFIVQEARDYCIERGSPLHVCYMDGFIYKLFTFGVKGKMLRLIWNSFKNCSSRVLLSGHLSKHKAQYVHRLTTLYTFKHF